jgi:hypothetical protein
VLLVPTVLVIWPQASHTRASSLNQLSETGYAAQKKLPATSEQNKIDSQLLFAIYRMRGEAAAKGAPAEEIKLRKDSKGRVLVDVRATVTKKLLARIKNYGGKVISSSARDDSIIAFISLDKLEFLAQAKDVRFIMPAAEAINN